MEKSGKNLSNFIFSLWSKGTTNRKHFMNLVSFVKNLCSEQDLKVCNHQIEKDKTHHKKYLDTYSSLSSFSTVPRNTCMAISVTVSSISTFTATIPTEGWSTTRISTDQYGFNNIFFIARSLNNATCVVCEGKKHKHLRFLQVDVSHR